MCSENIIQTEDLGFSYGECQALKGISISVRRGEIFGLLGPNGAGKSTFINVLTTLLRPTNGMAIVCGFDTLKEPLEVRKRICLLMQERGLDYLLSLYDNLYFYAGLQGIPKSERRSRINELIDLFGLKHKRDASLASLSAGLVRRVMIARIFLSRAQVFFLDEPTAGVDLKSRKDFWDLLRMLRNKFELTAILATHDLEEAETLCDRICFLKEGGVIALDCLENLKRLINRTVIRVQFRGTNSPVLMPEGFPGLVAQHTAGNTLEIIAMHKDGNLGRIFGFLDAHNGLRALEVRQPNLSDVFEFLMDRKDTECCAHST